MAVTIVAKGETVALKGKNTVTNALVGAGWNPNEGQSTSAFDLDASVVGRDASGNAVVVCYYGDKDPAPWIHHTGDNLTGEGAGDDEQIIIKLGEVPAEIVKLDVVVHIYEGAQRGQNFGMVEDAFVRIARDNAPETDVLRYDLSSDDMFAEVGMHFASIVRNGPSWDFNAVGQAKPEYATLDSFQKATT